MTDQIRARIAELRAAGHTLAEAHTQAHSEAAAAQDKAWRAEDPER